MGQLFLRAWVFLTGVVAAEPTQVVVPPDARLWDWNRLLWNVTQVVVYVVLGLGLFGITFLLINYFTPFSIRKEIEEDQNVSLAVVIGSVFIGIAIILAAAIHG